MVALWLFVSDRDVLRAVVIGGFLVGLVGFGRSHPGNLSVRGRSDRPDLLYQFFGPTVGWVIIQKTNTRVHEKTDLKLSL